MGIKTSLINYQYNEGKKIFLPGEVRKKKKSE